VSYLTTVLADQGEPPIAAGEIVSTGTLTDALPVRAGQLWKATPHGIDLPSSDVRLIA
jgi:2-oxo-3-hexenedioate decarboxylase